VRGRCSEQGHDRIPDELLDRAAVALELGPDALVVRPQDRLHVLRIECLGLRGEPDEVAEHDRDDLALAALTTPRHG
jgi:RecJ-like exonuclease